MSAKFCFLGDDVTAEASTAMAARGAREALGTAEKPKKELATEGQDFDHDAYYAEAPVASGVGHRYPRARAAVFWMATYSPAARPKREHPPRLAESTLDSSNCSDVYGNARRGFRSNSGPLAKRCCTTAQAGGFSPRSSGRPASSHCFKRGATFGATRATFRASFGLASTLRTLRTNRPEKNPRQKGSNPPKPPRAAKCHL